MVILHLAVTNELQVVFDFPGFKALSLGISPRKPAWIFHLSIASIIPNKIRQEAQVAPSTMPGPQKELIKPANTLWVPLENHHFFIGIHIFGSNINLDSIGLDSWPIDYWRVDIHVMRSDNATDRSRCGSCTTDGSRAFGGGEPRKRQVDQASL